jgi:hypothetical protein
VPDRIGEIDVVSAAGGLMKIVLGMQEGILSVANSTPIKLNILTACLVLANPKPGSCTAGTCGGAPSALVSAACAHVLIEEYFSKRLGPPARSGHKAICQKQSLCLLLSSACPHRFVAVASQFQACSTGNRRRPLPAQAGHRQRGMVHADGAWAEYLTELRRRVFHSVGHFRISPRNSEDAPQQILMLQAVDTALVDADQEG